MLRCLWIVLLIVSTSCDSQQSFTELTYDQMIDAMSAQKIKMGTDVEYLDLDGAVLTKEQVKERSNDLPYALWLVNADSVLVKVQLRDVETARMANKTAPLLKNGPADIDCNDLSRLLERIYNRDQDNRRDNLMDQSIDEQNLEVVEQILEKCGMPTPDNAGYEGPNTVWLVIQHAGADKRKRYFSDLLAASKKGHIDRQSIALMQDRMLMDDGQPQLYGSQVSMTDDGAYELYDLRDPETVDSRRAIMGMPPLKEYLMHFDLEFNVPQKTN